MGLEILKYSGIGSTTPIKTILNNAVSQIGEEGLYFKSDILRNSGVGQTNIADEFLTLQNMHSIQPHRVVQPLDLSLDGAGNILGYNMERFPGVSLGDYTAYGLDIPKYTLLNIDKSIKKLHNKGIVHGDLHPGNIMIDPTTGRDFRLIDPVGYPNLFDNTNDISRYLNKEGIFGLNEGKFRDLANEPLGFQKYLIDQDYHQLNRSLFVPNKFSLPYSFPKNSSESFMKGRKMNLKLHGYH